MECKAKMLCDEQTGLIRDKSRELAKVVNEFNLVSQIWASERELKLYANQQLSERLAALTGNPVDLRQGDPMPKAQPAWKRRPDLADPVSSMTKMDQSPLVYSLFGALCKEIRRLQTRSANLVDALNNLNSGHCNPAQIAQINLLVHRTQSTRSNSNTIKTPNRRDSRRPKSKSDQLRNGFSWSETGLSSVSPHSPITHFDFSSNSQHSADASQSTTYDALLRHDPAAFMLQSNIKARRRRPVSFYLKRTFEPVLEDIIHEADEEVLDSP
ncbi:unnamed protein product [Echinostoma caproni]|uniref:Uncharacterized protein n=1 Tax=Echinostoma caproni TaxID=27848 RepID=A0A183ARK4_9TREM|nr:unnamed protein product [Echinostoma caproni]